MSQGLATSTSHAQALILAGEVLCGPDHKVQKPGELLPADTLLSLRGDRNPFVSRGGLKLAGALDHFGLTPAGVCLDVGASTGGFTDCLLQRGAKKVYAVDVGHGQIAWKLRQDPRVVVIERTHVRDLNHSQVPELCDFVVMDVSFISLRNVLPHLPKFLTPDARLVALVKPQFEVMRSQIDKGGIVNDPIARQAALDAIVALGAQLGFGTIRTMTSPILGTTGNVEFLLAAQRDAAVERS